MSTEKVDYIHIEVEERKPTEDTIAVLEYHDTNFSELKFFRLNTSHYAAIKDTIKWYDLVHREMHLLQKTKSEKGKESDRRYPGMTDDEIIWMNKLVAKMLKHRGPEYIIAGRLSFWNRLVAAVLDSNTYDDMPLYTKYKLMKPRPPFRGTYDGTGVNPGFLARSAVCQPQLPEESEKIAEAYYQQHMHIFDEMDQRVIRARGESAIISWFSHKHCPSTMCNKKICINRDNQVCPLEDCRVVKPGSKVYDPSKAEDYASFSNMDSV